MNHKDYKIIQNRAYGYRHLSPLPDQDRVKRFYRQKYYRLVRKGEKAMGLTRLLNGKKDGRKERLWLRSTLYLDICYFLRKFAPGKRILDVGCGQGELMFFLKEKGFNVTGIEPSLEAAAKAKLRKINVYNLDLEKFVKKNVSDRMPAFDAVILLNVLEHILNPLRLIKLARKILQPNGILSIRVPNDFSRMQIAAQKNIGKRAWWIAGPDHIYYFNYDSLKKILRSLGFDIIYSQGDFPMELFLLNGVNYIFNRRLGNQCHEQRIRFERSVAVEYRRRLYQRLAEAGIGRNCLVFAKLK